MRRIVVCADDYALAPGVSRAIRELASRGRLNAISVMAVIPGFEQECASLLSAPSPIPLAIGLHVTLTGPFKPLAALPIATADGNFTSIARYLPPLGFFRIDRKAVKAEISAQIRASRLRSKSSTVKQIGPSIATTPIHLGCERPNEFTSASPIHELSPVSR